MTEDLSFYYNVVNLIFLINTQKQMNLELREDVICGVPPLSRIRVFTPHRNLEIRSTYEKERV
jgi:hypothetical protein